MPRAEVKSPGKLKLGPTHADILPCRRDAGERGNMKDVIHSSYGEAVEAIHRLPRSDYGYEPGRCFVVATREPRPMHDDLGVVEVFYLANTYRICKETGNLAVFSIIAGPDSMGSMMIWSD
jgi:hypothetical protein